MYELFLKCRRKKTVANMLNEAGHRTRNGSKFTDTTVARLLRDTTAKGIRRANYTKSLGEKKHWVYKPRNEWVETPIPAIVDSGTWDRVNAILEQRHKTRIRRPRRAVQLFAGIAFCHCGTKMRVPSNNKKYDCPNCHNKIGLNDLEEVFHHQLKYFLFSPDDVMDFLKSADDTIKNKEELLKSLTKEQVKVQTEMKKIYRLYMEDQITSEGFGSSYKPLEARLKEISDELPELQGEVDFLKIQYLSSDDILTDFTSLYERWKTLSQEEKRIVVEHSVERISVGTDEITIELGYMPSSSELMASKQRWNIAALLKCHYVLRVAKPPYPYRIVTIGDFLRKRRFSLGLTIKNVADKLGVNESTVRNWEANRRHVSLGYRRRVQEFLGVCPYDASLLWAQRLKERREFFGITRKGLAKMFDVDEHTVSAWEERSQPPTVSNMEKISTFLRLPLAG